MHMLAHIDAVYIVVLIGVLVTNIPKSGGHFIKEVLIGGRTLN